MHSTSTHHTPNDRQDCLAVSCRSFFLSRAFLDLPSIPSVSYFFLSVSIVFSFFRPYLLPVACRLPSRLFCLFFLSRLMSLIIPSSFPSYVFHIICLLSPITEAVDGIFNFLSLLHSPLTDCNMTNINRREVCYISRPSDCTCMLSYKKKTFAEERRSR